MQRLTSQRTALVAILICLTARTALAAAGTSVIASKGRNAHVSKSWPAGAGELVNDPARTVGWNSWFTEWPNDVNQYAFEITSTDDLNRLIGKLAATKSENCQIHLSHLKEPRGLGWATKVPEGNNIAVIFSIGDQEQIDRWYEQVRKPFGKMEFTEAPVAVPPTLTIFVQNTIVKLDDLKIPPNIAVSRGYVPTVFHRSNVKRKLEVNSETAAQITTEKLDSDSQAAVDQIAAFLKRRKTPE